MPEGGEWIVKRRSFAGYVLLEALVGLLIFSLGLLGLIGFQASAMKIASDSRFRTEAAMLADELIGKMSMSKISTVQTEYSADGSKFSDWLNNRVKGGSKLPGAAASVTFATANTNATLLATVTISWDLPGSSGRVGDSLHGVYVTQAMLF